MRRDTNRPEALRVEIGKGHYDIAWRDIPLGGSIFLPTVHAEPVILQVTDICNHLRIRLVYQERIESGIYGVRFWRI